MKTEYAVKAFATERLWRRWLDSHHARGDGLWLRIYKKGSGIASVTYAGALDQALCYGWIDGQKKSYDEQSFLQKFTPRRPKSMWSKRNIEHVARLTAKNMMMPSGVAEVERAKADGRWAAAYDSPINMLVPDDFLSAVGQDKNTSAFYETLNKTNRYAIAWRLQTAKTPETRKRRFDALLDMLRQGKKLH